MVLPVDSDVYKRRIDDFLGGGLERVPNDPGWARLVEEIAADGSIGVRDRSTLLLDIAGHLSESAPDSELIPEVSWILDGARSLMVAETEPHALLRLAGLLRGNSDFAPALDIYLRILSGRPADRSLMAIAHNGAAVALWRCDQKRDALAEFEAALCDAEASDLEGELKSEIAWNLVTSATRCGSPRRAERAFAHLLSPAAHVPDGLVEQLILDVLQAIPDLLDAGGPQHAAVLALQSWRLSCRRIIGNERVREALHGAAILANLGRARVLCDDHRKARGALEMALKRISVEAPNALDFIERICVALMSTYRSLGLRPEAVRTAENLVALKAAALGESHPDTLRAKATLARELYGNDQRKEAADLQRELTRVAEGFLKRVEVGALHVDLAKTLMDDGALLEADRCLAVAEQWFSTEATPGDLHAFYYARAHLFRKRSLPEKALPEVDRAMLASTEAFGERSNRLATPLQLRGGILLDLNRLDEARKSYEQVLTLENLLPTEEVKALHNLGNVAQSEKDLPRARRMYEQALGRKEALRQTRSSIATTLVNLGAVVRDLGDRPKAIEYVQRALQLEIEVFGADSVDVRKTRNNLAGALAGEGRVDEALDQMELVLDTQTRRLSDLLVLGTDHERLAALEDTALELQAYLGIAVHPLASHQALAVTVYGQILARKGLASEAFVRARHEPLTVDSLAIAVRGLEQLYGALPLGAVLVDFIEYGKARIDTGPNPKVPVPHHARLGAFVIGPGKQARFVDLGLSEPLKKDISGFLSAIAGRGRKTFREVSVLSQALAHLIWHPLGLSLDGVDHLILSPDGPLDRLSFAGLEIGPSQWLGEKCALTYISSGRELLIDPASVQHPTQPPIIFAAPYFGPRGATVWNDLKGAAREGTLVAEVCIVEPVTGDAATAEALLSVTSPRYLHIATHGVYCDPETLDQEKVHPVLSRLAKRRDPMERSALVMAVENAEAARATGDPRAAGIVTAGELCRLDLRGTALVVLSACDSGRGAPVALDGTHGLRRAFRAAGARCVIGSFWPVDDQATPGLMKSLYTLLEAGTPPHRALQEAARALKQVHREPHFWAPFFAYGISGAEF